MKKPLAIIWNDAHLKTGNEYEILMAFKHMLEYAVENGIDKMIFAGDLFDSRSFQRQEVIKTFDYILTLLHQNDITLYLFPGNHDKTLYTSEYSFLDIYRHHPCVKFNGRIERIEIDGVTIDLLPFFDDSLLVPIIEEAEGCDVLISHFEMAGSTNLGRVSEKKSITRKMLKKWKKVYLGHYHNTHEITKDIVHLPSLRQADFGEDSNKGFSVLYDDLSYEIIKGRFREFIKVEIDIDKTNSKKLKELIELHRDSENSIRFEFTGEDSNLKALDKALFKGTGIDVKTKFKERFSKDSPEPVMIKEFNKETVYSTFEEFCKDKGYDHETGMVYLNEFLKRKENV